MNETRRTRLLALTSTFPRWPGDPSPMFVADLCEGLARTMEVTVLAPGSQGALPVERWGNLTVRRFRYGWPARTQRLADGAIMPNIRRNPLLAAQVPPFVLAQFGAAWRLMRSERFDAIHAHWAVPQGVVAALLKRRFGVPLITTTHGGDIYALRGGPALRAKCFALRSSDRITAVSSALKREVVALGIDDRRIDVLPMGVDTARFTPEAASQQVRHELNPSGGPIMLFVGRLAEKKGARYAIEAMPAILREHPDARLIVVGDGPEGPSIERLARELGVIDRVVFSGAVANNELPAYYASVDVFIGPSVVEANGDTESFGVVFAEAMASGCPVVATDVGGIADVTGNGEYARLVPQRDAAAIAAAACDLVGNRALHAAVRDRGIQAMRASFDHAAIHRTYAEVIEAAVEARRLGESAPLGQFMERTA